MPRMFGSAQYGDRTAVILNEMMPKRQQNLDLLIRSKDTLPSDSRWPTNSSSYRDGWQRSFLIVNGTARWPPPELITT